jgi:hypothetical protein
MESTLVNLSCEVVVPPGEQLRLPDSWLAGVGPGRWLITVQALPGISGTPVLRDHRAFLNSYGPEDEGLYDDDPPR